MLNFVRDFGLEYPNLALESCELDVENGLGECFSGEVNPNFFLGACVADFGL